MHSVSVLNENMPAVLRIAHRPPTLWLPDFFSTFHGPTNIVSAVPHTVFNHRPLQRQSLHLGIYDLASNTAGAGGVQIML